MTQATESLSTSYPTVAPVRIRSKHAVTVPPVTKAYQTLMAALAAEQPHDIMGGYADRADIQERQEHLKAILDAVAIYAEWVVSDTSDNAPLGYLTTSETGYLRDSISEIDAAFDRAVDRMDAYTVAAE